MRTRIAEFRELVRHLGLIGALQHSVFGTRISGKAIKWARPANARFPLCYRVNSSDSSVLCQIFVDREYACLDDLKGVELILDCGANVGYSSAYFLSRHCNSRVIAVEPDPGNFEVLKTNLRPYGTRVSLVNACVWHESANLSPLVNVYRDGREWAQQFGPAKEQSSANVRGVEIGRLLAESGCSKISILKVDIEGAEALVFAGSQQAWLDSVDVIAIELHDDTVFGNASAAFFSAISGHDFDVSTSGELTICRRRVAQES